MRQRHKGIDYSVVLAEEPDRWSWQFQIGDTIKSGRVIARLELLARRRVEQQIDREQRAQHANIQNAAE
jgi:hypothetical protein